MELEFAYIGTESEFTFFMQMVQEGVPEANMKVTKILPYKEIIHEFVLSMTDEGRAAYKVGRIQSACYSKFGRLAGSIFSTD